MLDDVGLKVNVSDEQWGRIEQAAYDNAKSMTHTMYKFILEFGKIYKTLPAIKKKEMANRFIEKIEVFPEEKEDGSVIKSVTFRFPIKMGNEQIETLDFDGLTTDKHVETIVLLEKLNS